MPIATNSYARATGTTDAIGRTVMEGRTPAQVLSDLTAGLDAVYSRRGSNLSDLGNIATALSNLGLGTAALASDTDFQLTSATLTTVASNASAFGLVFIALANALAARKATAASGVISAQTSDVTIANTVTETTILGEDTGVVATRTAVGSNTLPANALDYGSVIRLKSSGKISTTATPTINFRLAIGGTVVLNFGTPTLGTLTDATYELDAEIICRIPATAGPVDGTVIAQGVLRIDGVAYRILGTAITTIDTTIALLVNATIAWGTANVANTITAALSSIRLEQPVAV